jgi:hypothetical protein
MQKKKSRIKLKQKYNDNNNDKGDIEMLRLKKNIVYLILFI